MKLPLKTYTFKLSRGKNESKAEGNDIWAVARTEEEAQQRIATAVWPRKSKLVGVLDYVQRSHVSGSAAVRDTKHK